MNGTNATDTDNLDLVGCVLAAVSWLRINIVGIRCVDF